MDNKITISRSYAEKCNLGNYESADFWSSRSLELPEGVYNDEELNGFSEDLFRKCYMDVQRQIIERKKADGVVLGFDFKKIQDYVDRMFNKKREVLTMSEYEECSPEEKDFLNSCKKLLKRVEAHEES